MSAYENFEPSSRSRCLGAFVGCYCFDTQENAGIRLTTSPSRVARS